MSLKALWLKTANKERALTELVELRAIYQRYNLDKQFLQAINSYLSAKRSKLCPIRKRLLGFWRRERPSNPNCGHWMGAIRGVFFNQPGLDTLFDEFTGALIAEKMKAPGATFPAVLREIREQYSATVFGDMNQIADYQAQLVERLVPQDAPERARTDMRAIVQKNTETALRSMLGKATLDQAVRKVRQGLEVSVKAGRPDVDAINAVKALRGPYYAGQYQSYEAKGMINAEAYNAADEEVQLHMMAGAYALDINQQLGFTLLTPQFVAEYIQRPTNPNVPDPVSFQMMRLMDRTAIFDRGEK